VASAHATYLPALVGAVDAKLGAGDDAGALHALEQLLAVDPASPGAAGRLELVRLRVAQDEMRQAMHAYDDGHFEEASLHVARALEATPENGAALRLASSIELGLGHPDLAESRARRAVEIDPQDPQAHAALGEALEASGRHAEALRAYERAVALDPSPEMRERRDALAKASATSGLPAPYREIETAATVSRADVAAVLGVRLAGTLAASPERSSEVVTDVRGHWAERWILSVVRARWMDPLPNHTFQPASTMRRADLAAVVARVLGDAAATRPRDLARWRDARPVFADVTRDHAAYRVAALAVSSGIMTADGGRFAPGRAVSGAELMGVMERLQRVLGR
jgi:tetratricopeptide (TPR) repeat protein